MYGGCIHGKKEAYVKIIIITVYRGCVLAGDHGSIQSAIFGRQAASVVVASGLQPASQLRESEVAEQMVKGSKLNL